MEISKFIFYLLLILLAYNIFYGFSTWKFFKSFGYLPLRSFIPIINFIDTLSIIKRPWWWIFILYIPIVGPILQIVIFIDLLECYNKKKIINIILVLIFNIFYITFLNYRSKIQFYGIPERKETFISSILFSVIFATIIHNYFIQPYTIPTSSMEKTLLVGDFLFVSKLHYGIRIPMTVFALPFLQSKIPGTAESSHNQINSYFNQIQLPYYRIPGWQKIKRYDIVTFNYPTDSSHTIIDRKDPYVKRCLGLPGDIISFKNGRAFINGSEEKLPIDTKRQFSYIVVSNNLLNKEKINKFIHFDEFIIYKEGNIYTYFFKGLTKTDVKKIMKFSNVLLCKENIENVGYKFEKFYDRKKNKIDSTNTIFPEDKPWNPDQYGPLYIPKKGDKIKVNKKNITQYYNIITRYENNKNVVINKNKIFINGKPINEYKIKQNYYFMVGDNRDISLDSRFFGYVPEDHILGKPIFIWLSLEGLFDSNNFGIRLNRMFTTLNSGKIDTYSYLYYFLFFLFLYLFWSIWNIYKKKK